MALMPHLEHSMDQGALFYRRYQAALLEYVAGNGESGLVTAYELGRSQVEEDACLLEILNVHQQAVSSVLDAAPASDRLHRLMACDEFLMEALSAFELTSRGYVALLNDSDRHDRA
jgi:hypothetical protein